MKRGTGGAISIVPVVGWSPWGSVVPPSILLCKRLSRGSPVVDRIIRHHTEYGQSGQRVQMKTLPAGWWSPPPRPPAGARAIRLFDRSDFTRFRPPYRAYRLHSGADSPLEGLSLPWMPRIPASMFMRLYAAIHRSGAGQSGASRAVRGIPPKNGGLERAPECRLPGPKRTLAPSGV